MNRKTTYGIRALASMARARPRCISVAELAKSEGIPPKFLSVILLDLRRHGIVQGRRGRVGGYELAVDPPGSTPKRCRECPGTGRCPAELALRGADIEVNRVLSSISLSDVVRGVAELESVHAEARVSAPGSRERSRGGSRLR